MSNAMILAAPLQQIRDMLGVLTYGPPSLRRRAARRFAEPRRAHHTQQIPGLVRFRQFRNG